MWRVRPESPEDAGAVETLVRLGFGAGRFAKTAYRLREGVEPVAGLSFVATDDKDELLGAVRFWPVKIGERVSLLLGPLAVRPDLRGQGIGIALMQHGLDAARAQGHESVILVGDEPYYAKVSFAKVKAGQIRFPGPVDPARVLALSFKPGAVMGLSGEVKRAKIDEPVSAQAAPLG